MASSEKEEKAVALLESDSDDILEMTVDQVLEIIEGKIPEIPSSMFVKAAAAGPSKSTSNLLEATDDAVCLEAECEVEVVAEEITTKQSAESEMEVAETCVEIVGSRIGISPGLKELSKITGPYPTGAKIMAKKCN